MVTVKQSCNPEMRQVDFLFPAEAGHKVALAGSFNDWEQDMIPMEYSAAEGCYCCSLQLPCGGYEYKLVVDGEWVTDPDNPNFTANDFGTLNSVITVG